MFRFDNVHFVVPDRDLGGIAAGISGALVDAPGILRVFADTAVPAGALFTAEQVELVVRLETADAPGRATVLRILLNDAPPEPSYQKKLWRTYTEREF